QPDQLAYVIYTSGSTGTPKGVLLTHCSLVNYIYAARERYTITSADRVLQFASISFDASAEEIYSALSCGATLVLRTDEMLASPDTFLRQCERWQISVLSLPTAFWHLLVDEVVAGAAAMPDCVRITIIGGERANLERVIAWQQRVGTSTTLMNSYGPTESTIVATAYEVPPVLAATLPGVPIGQPLANLSAYILDAQLQPVPIGGTGELYLGGAGLARGYLNQPALTAEKFVPDPFSGPEGTPPGSRLYKTGDLARYRGDGQIDFVGRSDHQIKLRGFRVELGEIETALRQHPGVREAIVEVIEQRGDKQIVAYVVGENLDWRTQNLEDESEAGSRFLVLGSSDLRTFLQGRLPVYMLPSAIVMLDALPLTASGKINRKALPLPDISRADQGQIFVGPRTPTEELIASVWETILGVSPIGIYDNFFTLGGHSLLATQAITRLRHILGLDLPLRLLFEAPTIAAFAAQLTAQHTDHSLPLLPVMGDGRPLSFAQQRLWFLDQLQPGSAAYHLPTVVRLTGALDVAALQQSLNTLVARHESLRTVFAQHDGQPIQHVLPAAPVPLPILDVPDPSDHAALVQLVRDQVQPPFDLERGPLLRATLLRLSPDAHVLVLTLHHIVSDGWSQSVLLRELTTLYRGGVLGEPIALPALPIQYADYSVWQRQWLAGDVLDQQLSYWRQQLAGIQPLDLPTDRPRPPVTSERGAAVGFPIAPEVSTALVHLSQQLGATLFMTLLAAWQTLLSRYSGQTDIAVGTPIAGRVRPELEGVVGFFVNTLVLRSDLTGQPSFADLVARVRTTALGAYAHQDLPFEMLVEAVQPARDLSRSPLFQVMFALQNTPRTTIDLPELTLEPLGMEQQTAKFDLTLSVTETPSGMYAALEYRTELFDPPTIARMAEHFQTLLAAIVADPQRSIAALPLLTDAEHQQLLAWNPISSLPVDARTVHVHFEAQVARTPDAIAVSSDQTALRYHALNARANQLARHLRSLGVGPDTRVGLSLPRSVDLIVALLATLKAGGCAVPLDPAYPAERSAFMLADSQACVVLTQASHREALPSFAGAVVCLDRDGPVIARQPATNPDYPVSPHDLAYVIYTSGSTGTPKGVAVDHTALAAHAATVQQVYGLSQTDRVLQFASPAFDVAIEQIVPPLLTGACVVLRDAELTSPTEFTGFIEDAGLTFVNLPPVYWRAWVTAFTHEGHAVPPALRLVLVGGDAMPADTVHLWQTSPLRRVRLLNGYGPTETIITATTFEVPASAHETPNPQSIPIGRPLAHRTAYILDPHGALVPIGVPGELYLGGSLLARGYLDQPVLTAERFLPDPFSAQPGARLYRTGDRARYRPDGQIEFLGRIDHQVKVRGYRIELGEIEAALRRHEAVHDAVVVLRDERLVAYVVENLDWRTQNLGEKENQEQEPVRALLAAPSFPPPPAATDAEAGGGSGQGAGGEGLIPELRSFLKGRLPEYMVPTVIMLLPALPLSPSGKVNRAALPVPELTRAGSEQEFVAPRTPT
ncbi:MAG: amino acid adenylation domain-containing protein, partial [Chloroflexi bacterium]|nr:amino acid adenylation domain-containing protein [Chloroflexota bacterium]